MNAQVTYKDRKGWLIAFGVYQVLAGLIFALSAGFLFLSDNKITMPRIWIIAGGLMMTAIAIQRVMLGIGSIQARRWARALVLIFSCVELVTGTLTILVLFFMTQPALAPDSNLSQQDIGMIRLFSNSFRILISVVIPLIFILFYGSNNVKKTCESRNPASSWTDRCPLPVLGLSIYKFIGGVALLGFIPFGFGYPFFFMVLGGMPAKLIWLVSSGLMIYAAILLYKLDIKGWLIAMILYVFYFINMVCFLLSKGFAYYFNFINEPYLQGIMQKTIIPNKNILSIHCLAIMVGVILYLIFIRKYFHFDNLKQKASTGNS